MAQTGWFAMAMPKDFEAQLKALCRKIEIDPDTRGAYARAIRFAVQHTLLDGSGTEEKQPAPVPEGA